MMEHNPFPETRNKKKVGRQAPEPRALCNAAPFVPDLAGHLKPKG